MNSFITTNRREVKFCFSFLLAQIKLFNKKIIIFFVKFLLLRIDRPSLMMEAERFRLVICVYTILDVNGWRAGLKEGMHIEESLKIT